LKLEYVVKLPIKPMLMADRSVGGHASVADACITAAIAKQPATLTIRVP
jgi:hypothetical protein